MLQPEILVSSSWHVHENQCNEGGQCLHIQDLPARSYCSVHSCNDHTCKEEDDHIDIATNESAPQEPGREEPVVESLIRGEHARRFGPLRCESERAQASGLRPEKHLEGEDVDMDERNHGYGDHSGIRHGGNNGRGWADIPERLTVVLFPDDPDIVPMPPDSPPRPLRPIRIVVADDHAIVRQGLRSLIEEHPGFTVVAEAANGAEALKFAVELRPDVLLLDISMPEMTGTEVAEAAARDCPGVKVLALSMHEERGYVSRLLASGAAGYVLKRTAAAELLNALRIVASGRTYVDPSLAGDLLTRQGKRTPSGEFPKAIVDLTPREAEAIRLVALGHSNKEIGEKLEISVKTVETHRANAMNKLGLRSRAALVRFAIDAGWLESR